MDRTKRADLGSELANGHLGVPPVLNRPAFLKGKLRINRADGMISCKITHCFLSRVTLQGRGRFRDGMITSRKPRIEDFWARIGRDRSLGSSNEYCVHATNAGPFTQRYLTIRGRCPRFR